MKMGKPEYRQPQPTTQVSQASDDNSPYLERAAFLDRVAIELFPSYALAGMSPAQAAKATYDAAKALLAERTMRG